MRSKAFILEGLEGDQVCSVHSHTGAFEGGDSAHKPPCGLAIAWLGEVKEDWIQKTVHAGEGPGALIDD